MSEFKSSVLETLKNRNLIYQVSNSDNALDSILQNETTVYLGIDPTSSKLHIGNLVPLMIMKWIQMKGHKVIIVLGGATARIGDPSGKNSERNINTVDEIQNNILCISDFLKKFFKRSNEIQIPVEIINNDSWLHKISLMNFLSYIGKNTSVSKMLSLDSVKSRLSRDSYMSFTEFTYSLIQSYDFLHLYQEYGCNLQIGGSDQWGNIISGINLIKKIENNASLYGLTCPLITDANGDKIGKTEGNVSLSIDFDDILSSYDYWQFWRNTPDNDLETFLKTFTFLSLDVINKLLQDENINNAKIKLADEATSIIYGENILEEIHKTVARLYGTDQETNHDDINILKSISYSESQLSNGISYQDILIDLNLVSSISEAKRIIIGNGVKVNKKSIKNLDEKLTLNDFLGTNTLLLSIGNKVRIIKFNHRISSLL